MRRYHIGHIKKRGDRGLPCIMAHGGRAVVLAAVCRGRTGQPVSRFHRCALEVRDRRHFKVVNVAVANKLVRVVWVVWTRDAAFLAV